MILALALATILFAASWYFAVMRYEWNTERGAHDTFDAVVAHADKCARLARRGRFAIERYARVVFAGGSSGVRRVFFILFPAARPAFTERDPLVGLDHGPSSYFLHSIGKREKIKRTLTKTAQ